MPVVNNNPYDLVDTKVRMSWTSSPNGGQLPDSYEMERRGYQCEAHEAMAASVRRD